MNPVDWYCAVMGPWAEDPQGGLISFEEEMLSGGQEHHPTVWMALKELHLFWHKLLIVVEDKVRDNNSMSLSL